MRRARQDLGVPRASKAAFDAVVQITDDVCNRCLTTEYAELSRRLAAALARKRPSPLLHGTSISWACGIVYALGIVNFLFDPSQKPYFRACDLCALFGVSQSSASPKAHEIMRKFGMVQLHPEWCLPSRLADNPRAWMVTANGIPVDVRMLPREAQEAAWRAGLIPFVPGAAAQQADAPARTATTVPVARTVD
jgi:hypothetical protein